MLMARVVRKAKLAVLTLCVLAGSTVCSCGLTDIRDNLISGALAGVKGAATTWVDGILPDLNEIIEAMPDNPLIDTP